MRLIFVNRFYWPDEPATAQLLTDLAEALAGFGHDVTVIASQPDQAGVPRTELRNGVRIVRVRGTRFGRGSLAGKALDLATFFFGALSRLLTAARRDTTVIALTDPPLVGIGAWLVARFRGARVIHWVQDIYPELAIELAGQRWLRVLQPLRNAAWRHADRCVTLGSDMASVLAEARVAPEKISVIGNWAPAGLGQPPPSATDELRTAWGLTGKFVVAYSGNLGRVHDLDPVLELAAALRDAAEIAFVFVGEGPQRARLEAEAVRRNLRNVSFRPAQPRSRLAETLALGDLHLVTVRHGCERLVFPSKLYGILAVGRPVLFIGPPGCEIARLVTENRFGHVAERKAIAGLAAVVRRIASDPGDCARLAAAARQFGSEHDAPTAAAHWHSLLVNPPRLPAAATGDSTQPNA